MKNRKRSFGLTIIILAVILVVLFIVSLFLGRYALVSETIEALTSGSGDLEVETVILLKVRLPRIIGAVLIGGMLSVSGASYQGMLRNPMVSPDFLGASAGAGFGAALALLLGADGVVLQLVSFGFGMTAVFISYGISRVIEGVSGAGIIVLVLTGMVVASLFSAFISIIKYVADPYDELPTITFWLMGGLSYVTADEVLMMLVPLVIALVPMLLLSWRLNILSMGDAEAASLGISVKYLRLIYIVGATLLTSSAVSVAGMVGWVGLIIPHFARMMVGVDHRKLLPVSLFLGGIFLLFVDDIARSMFSQEIPLGILTAIVGAPFFLYLLLIGKCGWTK